MMLVLLAAAGALLAEPTPAPAAQPLQQMKKVVIDAIRDCPPPVEGEIAVCAPDKGYSQRYRLPKVADRYVAAAEAVKRPPILVEDGALEQCGPVGAGGTTGCSLAQAKAWGEEKKRRKAAGEWFPW